MSRYKNVGSILCLLICGGWLGSCRSSHSNVESIQDPTAIGEMSEADFVTACEARKVEKGDNGSTEQVLIKFTQTGDCRKAYPIIRRIVLGK